MYKGSRSRFFPVVVVLIIIAIIVFALVSLIRVALNKNNDDDNPAATSLTSQLLNTDGSRSVSMQVRGPIVANENFRSYEITISPTDRTITTWAGYQHEKTIASKTLDNDTKGYEEFVHALDYAGYTQTGEAETDNTNGLCADGRVYDFILSDGANALNDRWTTNCKTKGTFRGDGPTIRLLFLKQIPNADKLVSDVGL